MSGKAFDIIAIKPKKYSVCYRNSILKCSLGPAIVLVT